MSKKISELERTREETEALYLRAERCVCKLCGHQLTPSMIIYNKYGGQGIELYCPNCQMTEYGVEPELYQLAQKFVDVFEFNHYLDMEENERNHLLNVGKICEIMSWLLKQIGVMDKEGLIDQPPSFSKV